MIGSKGLNIINLGRLVNYIAIIIQK